MTNKKIIIIISLCLAGSMMLTACKVSGSNTSETTDATIIVSESSVAETTKEPTETAAATTSAAAETTGETAAVTTAASTAALPAVTVLSVPATYTASFDTVRIYTDASRTTIQSVLAKGGQVTITGTADKYGVTAEGYYVNLNLMTLVVTVTPTPAETTAATTKETMKPTPKPTKETTAETEAPVETAAPPVETAAPVATTAAPVTDYTAVCAEIRSKLIATLEANGQWDEAFTGESTNGGSQWWGVGFYDDREMSTDDFAQHFYANKFDGMAICGTSITCYIADGNINIAYKAYWTS